jgi:hypothetical protein
MSHPDTAGRPYPELLLHSWSASWIWAPGDYNPRFAVAYFRREFDVDDPADAELVLHVSADSRYCLAVNGEFFGRGPARSDLDHYNFETYDVSSRLRPGRNVLAAQVIFYGLYGPLAEIHSPDAALIVQGTLQTRRGSVNLDSGPQWRALADSAYSPRFCQPNTYYGPDNPQGEAFFAVNPFEKFDGAKFPRGWPEIGYDDSSWPMAVARGPGCGRYVQFPHPRGRWRLVPRQIKHLREEQVFAADVLPGPRCEEMRRLLQPGGGPPLAIPAHSAAEWTIYLGKLLTGYPAVTVSGGRGAEVELAYAEALTENGLKAQRDDLDYGRMEGEPVSDLFLPGGGEEIYQPFSNYRCARFLRLRVKTGDQPLVLKDLRFFFTSYPFDQRGRFDSSDPDLKKIWNTAWHTALCCAHEHYEDCPFYEQMQYVSDTRLQMLISYYVAGDDSLARAGIRTFDRSRLFDGLTQSRYPSNHEQIIPPFSLFYILMIEDHFQHFGDWAFLAELVPGLHSLLRWFDRYLTADGLLGRMPWWEFVDWAPPWSQGDLTTSAGMPPEAVSGSSTQITLLYVAALDSAARLLTALGEKGHADFYAKRAATIRRAVRRQAWSETEGLFLDGPGSKNLSQHSNLWAILTDTATPAQIRRIMKRLLDDPKLVRTTYIHEYYLFQALVKIGAWDLLDRCVDRWRDLLRHGFSTFPETAEPSRSDCHAWSAWPMFEFQRVLLGIRPAAPGFASALIAPKPFGRVTEAAGAVPTCRGEIAVAWKMADGKFALKASLPRGLPARIELPDGRVMKVAKGGKVTFGDAALARTMTLKTAPVRK